MHITKWKKPICIGCILCDYNHMTFWKRQNYGDSKKISGFQRLGEGGVYRQSTEDLWWGWWGGQWNHSTSYHTGGHMSLYICPNPENIQQSEPQCKPWTWDDNNVSVYVLTNVPFWCVRVTVGYMEHGV